MLERTTDVGACVWPSVAQLSSDTGLLPRSETGLRLISFSSCVRLQGAFSQDHECDHIM